MKIYSTTKAQSHNRPRGTVMVWAIVSMTALTGFISLAVDMGRAQVAKTELQRAVDAAARYAITGRANNTAVTRAIAAANDNKVDGTPLVLQSSNVTVGTWANGTFTPGGSATNAVRVVAQRNVPLMFARVIGKENCTVSATAIVTEPDYGFGVVGLDFISMVGNTSQSYWSDGKTGGTTLGSIASNGSITLTGASSISGNAYYGTTIIGAEKVSGSVTQLTSTLSYPNGNPGNAQYSNNNASISAYGGYVNSSNDFGMGNNRVCTFAPGVYYFRNFDMESKANLTVNGPVTVYITGSLSISGQASNTTGKPADFKIVMCPPANSPPSVGTITSGTALNAHIYAPQSYIVMSGQGDFYGAMLAKGISMSGGSAIHYDLALSGSTGVISLVK